MVSKAFVAADLCLLMAGTGAYTVACSEPMDHSAGAVWLARNLELEDNEWTWG